HDVAVEHLGPLRLELNLAARERDFLAAHDLPRVGQHHVHVAVDDVYAGAADGQQLDGVPFAGRAFVVGALDDARVLALLAVRGLEHARHGILGAALHILDRTVAGTPGRSGLDVHHRARDAPVIAAVVLLDLALLRAHPERPGRPVRADAVVEQPAVAHVL